MNQELKRVIEKLFEICDESNSTGGCSQTPMSVQLKKEMVDFLSYLSASDGIIGEEEALFLEDYFSEHYTAESLREYIDRENTYSTDFESKVPDVFDKFICIDNNREEGDNRSVAKAYIKVFEVLGKEFLICDGEATENEVSDLSIYTAMLMNYLKAKLKGFDTAVSFIDVSLVHAGEKVQRKGQGKSSDELIEELNSLIGLDMVKRDVNSLIHLQEINRLRVSRGLKQIPVSNHLVFYGNPGTGKTTVARLLAKIYHSMGILSKGQLIEVDRSGLVGGYVGQTAIKTQDVIKSALGGVLFIDEAYSLSSPENLNDYGSEVIDTLLKAMEDHREDFIVIVAGYPDLMVKFVDSNPGLRSRFNKYINFEDYSVDELLQIFKLMCSKSGYKPTQEALDYTAGEFERKYKNRGKNFANAREVRNYFEKAVAHQADRLFVINDPTNEQLEVLELDDVKDI